MAFKGKKSKWDPESESLGYVKGEGKQVEQLLRTIEVQNRTIDSLGMALQALIRATEGLSEGDEDKDEEEEEEENEEEEKE